MKGVLFQNIAVAVIVSLAVGAIFVVPLFRNFVAPFLARYFLQKGNIGWAMRFKKWSNKGCC